MVPMVTDLTDFCFSSQLLLIHTNGELKRTKNVLSLVQGAVIYSTKPVKKVESVAISLGRVTSCDA
jgi:hypothetical protein